MPTGAALLGLARGWGRSSLGVVRADPGLLPELAVGRWLDQPIAVRACGPLLGSAAPALAAVHPDLLAIAARAAFWRGVRSAATAAEWRRLRSGYTALLYHRLAGELKPGQERLDVAPRAFDRQMRLLRLLGMQPLTVERLVDCHAPGGPPFPRRGVVVTADDAFRDVVEPLRRHAGVRPLLFVPTAAVGGPAGWLDGEEVASWKELADLAESGVALGAHGRTHAQLPELADALAEEELRGSRDDLARQLRIDAVAFAYPNGRHGAREQALAAAAGYRIAFTTQLGRNGPGSDPFRLRRVSVKAWDSRLSFAWKLLTGEQPPRRWESWLILRSAAAGRLARGCRSARDRAAAAWPRSAARTTAASALKRPANGVERETATWSASPRAFPVPASSASCASVRRARRRSSARARSSRPRSAGVRSVRRAAFSSTRQRPRSNAPRWAERLARRSR